MPGPIRTHNAKNSGNHFSPMLSTSSMRKIQTALSGSWAPSTMQGYRLAIQKYHQFCDRENISKPLRTPASELVLCAFAADNVGKLSAAVAHNQLAAIKAWHVANNWTWHGSDRLTQILRGVKNLAPITAHHEARQPIPLHAIELLNSRLDKSNRIDAAILACAYTAFWGQCRLRELLPSSSKIPTPGTLPLCTSLRLSTRNKSAWVLHLPRTRTNSSGQDVVLVRQRSSLDPISAIQQHLLINRVPHGSPLFAYYSDSGHVSMLSKKTFLERCNKVWTEAKYPRYTGHCFRIGGTTELLLAKVPPDVVKTMGRWSSDAFLKYWRSIEDIVPLHAKNVRTHRK
ncbi:hypothetical protein NP233_g11130 [Leucocoprinus birnbaumii]|uniref:Uncharacterized protein n=1 Tax=Leucocoprinus birnbaumii TaxID=56174 RepID=A0AAD5VN17_9AGAR|nr:hypothetical protein NP233_g11130 [Leucocoprinus birnbaumii]